MRSDNTLRLALLKFQGEADLTASKLTPAQRLVLDRFARQTGAVQWLSQGRGGIYRVTNPVLFATHLRDLVPDEQISSYLPLRAQHIASARNSKSAAHHHEYQYLLLKSVGGAVSWNEATRNISLDLELASRDYGAASLLIHTDDGWETNEELWLVENQALFDQTDWFPPETKASLLYYGGQISNNLLNWLSSHPRAGKVVHFPDYDGVGLANYARLYAKLGESCVFWLMPDWSEKLARYGNSKLWRETLREFTSAFPSLPAHLSDLLVQMRNRGLALEQEAVWLDNSA